MINRDKFDQASLLLPKGLKKEIEELGRIEHRSISQQVAYMAETYLKKYKKREGRKQNEQLDDSQTECSRR